VGDERASALIGVASRSGPRPELAKRAIAVRRLLVCSVAATLLSMAGSAPAQPTVTISPPVVKGQQSPPAANSAATDQTTAKRIEEDRVFRVNRVIVEGFRDPDDRAPRPQTVEQRFSTSLNRGSPELIPGKIYDGCMYDGTYFSCADPLSSALRNLRHALR
jgi:hypothetical protein